ncbi:MAG: hypothetical protein HY835_07725 [Anaerolineae bacterium]|nr:hypothetical protein [Anaerolineae bacterium]
MIAIYQIGDLCGFCLLIDKSPEIPAPYLRFYINGLFRWNAPGSILRNVENPGGFCLQSPHQTFNISVLGRLDPTPINASHPGVLIYGDQTAYVRCNHTMSPVEMDAFLTEKRAAWDRTSLAGGGTLQDAPEAMLRGILWNTIYEPIKERICTPVTREWCIIKPERPWFGSYVLFVWDTCFNALIAAGQSKELAEQQIYSLLQGMVNGMLPLVDSEVSIFDDRSQPPVAAFVALKLYHQFGDAGFLDAIFERLLTWHRWWLPNRDRNGDGLLEWGTDLPVTHTDYQGYLDVAKCESGLDNSPMYDDTTFDPELHTMRLADVGLNSLYALDCWALAEIAAILSKHAGNSPSRAGTEQELRAEYIAFGERINRELWNEQLGIYCNRHWDGRLSATLSPTCFYPMLAGIAPRERAERMLNQHLLNPQEFWGEYALPASAKDHPAFADNNYWRGRIWAPTNFLVYEGLKRCGYDEATHQLARKSLALFLQEWQAESHIHENYNTLTGDGDDVSNADPVYTWGGLLALTGMSELVHVRVEGGLDFGSLSGEPAALHNFHAAGGVYTITTAADGLVVKRSDGLEITTSAPARITGFRQSGDTLIFTVSAAGGGSLALRIPAGVVNLDITANNLRVIRSAQENGLVRIPLG